MNLKKLKGAKVTKWVDLANNCMTPDHPYFGEAKRKGKGDKVGMDLEQKGVISVHLNVTKMAYQKVSKGRRSGAKKKCIFFLADAVIMCSNVSSWLMVYYLHVLSQGREDCLSCAVALG